MEDIIKDLFVRSRDRGEVCRLRGPRPSCETCEFSREEAVWVAAEWGPTSLYTVPYGNCFIQRSSKGIDSSDNHTSEDRLTHGPAVACLVVSAPRDIHYLS